MDTLITPITLPTKEPESIFGDMQATHVGIRTADHDGLIRWYMEKLEFRLIRKWNVGDLKLAFLAPANDDNFWIEVISQDTTGVTDHNAQAFISGYHHFCIAVKNVDSTLEELARRGVKTLRAPFDVPAIGKRCGFIADPFGNVIEFTGDINATLPGLG